MPRPRSSVLYGIRCPVCRGDDWRVLEARDGRGYIRRRHACNRAACRRMNDGKGVRFTSYQFQSTRRGVIAVPRDTHAARSVKNCGAQLQPYPASVPREVNP